MLFPMPHGKHSIYISRDLALCRMVGTGYKEGPRPSNVGLVPLLYSTCLLSNILRIQLTIDIPFSGALGAAPTQNALLPMANNPGSSSQRTPVTSINSSFIHALWQYTTGYNHSAGILLAVGPFRRRAHFLQPFSDTTSLTNHLDIV